MDAAKCAGLAEMLSSVVSDKMCIHAYIYLFISIRTSLMGWRWQHRGGSNPPFRTIDQATPGEPGLF